MRGTVSVWDENMLGMDGAGVLDGGGGCTAVRMYFMTLNGTLKNI